MYQKLYKGSDERLHKKTKCKEIKRKSNEKNEKKYKKPHKKIQPLMIVEFFYYIHR